MSRPRLITVVNQKGGVGKTTITCNMAFAAAEAGLKTLVVDFDTQGNTSQILLQNPLIHKERGGAEQFWQDDFNVDEMKTRSSPLSPMLTLIHGHQHLDVVTKDDAAVEKAVALRDQIRRLRFDRIVFDTPPSIGPLQVTPMLWSDILVIPIEPVQLGMSGLPALMDTISQIKRVNRSLQIAYVVNMYKSSSKEQRRIIEELREKLGSQIWAELPDRVAVADSLAEGRPAWRRGMAANRIIWRNFAQRVMSIDI